MSNEWGSCALCDRPLARPYNRHHLTPLSKGGKGTPTVFLHKICHDKIHAVLTENELKRRYATLESHQGQKEIAVFISRVQKKELQFYNKSARMNN